MIGLCKVFDRYGIDPAKVDKLRKQLESFEWVIDKEWMDQKDRISMTFEAPPEVAEVIELKRKRG